MKKSQNYKLPLHTPVSDQNEVSQHAIYASANLIDTNPVKSVFPVLR